VVADAELLAGGGPFGALTRIPCVFVLDKQGRLLEGLQGDLEMPTLEAALRRAEQRH
jgi:hypothetical protein